MTPDRIVVCSGFTQGLGLICQVAARRRRRDAGRRGVRPAGPARHRRAARRRCRGPASGSAGRTGDAAPVRRAGSATRTPSLLTPAHQFPLGGVLAPGRRAQAIEWAARTGGLLIEDDYDGEFRYDRQPVGAMQALAPEQVVYAGTASKSLAPGLRLGWLVVPADLVDEVAAAKALHRPALQQHRPAHAGRVHHLRGLRPAGAPLAAGLPAPAGPSRGGGPAPRPAGPGHRDRRRPARAPGTAARPGRGRDRRPGRGPSRPGPRRAPRVPRRIRPAPAQRWSSATPPRPSTRSPAPSPG